MHQVRGGDVTIMIRSESTMELASYTCLDGNFEDFDGNLLSLHVPQEANSSWSVFTIIKARLALAM